MGKRILIGSMLVLTLLLLMPSIPAVQHKSIEEGIKQDLQEKLDSINLDDLKDIEVLEWIRHPILYFIVLFFAYIQFLRFDFILSKAYEWFTVMRPGDYISTITNPILFWIMFLRGVTLLAPFVYWIVFWDYVSDSLGWDWNLPMFWPDD